MKIRAHLALQAVTLIAPVMLLAGYAIFTLLNAERDAQLRGIREAARGTSVAADREWSYAKGNVDALRTSVLLEQGDLRGLYAQAKRASPDPERYTAVLDATGQQLFNTAVPFGTPIAPPTPESQQRVAGLLGSGKPKISDLIRGRATNRYITTFEMPVISNAGTQYVLSQWVYAKYFDRVFPRTDVHPAWLFAIFDRDGRTIVRSKGPQEFEGNLPQADLLQAILRGETGYLRNTSRDGIKLYTVLDRSPTSGWTVAVGVPEEVIESAARRTVAVMAIGLMLVLALGIGLAVFFGRRLVRAISRAGQSAMLLSQHAVPALVCSRIDELDALQTNLHQVGMILQQNEQERATLMDLAKAAQNTAELQNQAKDDFLAMLGHELRNPLSAITAGISLMEAPGVGPGQAGRAREAIRRQCGLLTRIVDELLDASRVMHGKVSLSKKQIDLGAAVRACLEALNMRGVAARHHVSFDAVPALVDADPTRLDQIINNLLDNAFKYTAEGGSITVSVTQDDGTAQLRVADSGVGIEAELLPRLFDVFVQGPASLDRAKGGLGIGLSLVRAMVMKHGGAVTATSLGRGHGSTFIVRLPLASATPGTAGVAVEHAATGAAAGPARTGTLLLIDDNEDARDMLAEMLTLSAYEVLQADNGEAGIRLAMQTPLLAAVIDIGLPDISGYEVARRLRSEPRTASLRLIALTGYGQQADREAAREAGFDLHMTKPVDFATLFAALQAEDRV
jgi:signal transduction histidine kinase/ActR/RegA family two-component response regulator